MMMHISRIEFCRLVVSLLCVCALCPTIGNDTRFGSLSYDASIVSVRLISKLTHTYSIPHKGKMKGTSEEAQNEVKGLENEKKKEMGKRAC
ncbi:hypothetical protein BJY52DRAFT_1276155, partial [Lactarius psammicola]